jgi:Sec-independent protein translocase protein TatA
MFGLQLQGLLIILVVALLLFGPNQLSKNALKFAACMDNAE